MSSKERSSQLKDNWQQIHSEVSDRAEIIAVSKTFPAHDIKSLYQNGVRDFGENRIQDLSEKAIELAEDCPEIRWHFIGAIQSNKINKLLRVPNLRFIHSVDSLDILQALIKRKDSIQSQTVGIFLQVNTSEEVEKSGFNPNELENIQSAVELLQQEGVTLAFQGLMTMGKIRTDDFEEDAVKCFQSLKKLKEQLVRLNGLESCQLSMGMSQDYHLALENGSDWLRIGSKIFGLRKG